MTNELNINNKKRSYMKAIACVVVFCFLITQFELSWAQKVLAPDDMAAAALGELMGEGGELASGTKERVVVPQAKGSKEYMTNLEEFLIAAQKMKYKKLLTKFQNKLALTRQVEQVKHQVRAVIHKGQQSRMQAHQELGVVSHRAKNNIVQLASIALPFNYFPNITDGSITWYKDNLPHHIIGQRLPGEIYKDVYEMTYNDRRLLTGFKYRLRNADGIVLKIGERSNIRWTDESVHYASMKTNARKEMEHYDEIVTNMRNGVKEEITYDAWAWDARGRAQTYRMKMRSSMTPDKVVIQNYHHASYDDNFTENAVSYEMEERQVSMDRDGNIIMDEETGEAKLDYTVKYKRTNVYHAKIGDSYFLQSYSEEKTDQYGNVTKSKYKAGYNDEGLLMYWELDSIDNFGVRTIDHFSVTSYNKFADQLKFKRTVRKIIKDEETGEILQDTTDVIERTDTVYNDKGQLVHFTEKHSANYHNVVKEVQQYDIVYDHRNQITDFKRKSKVTGISEEGAELNYTQDETVHLEINDLGQQTHQENERRTTTVDPDTGELTLDLKITQERDIKYNKFGRERWYKEVTESNAREGYITKVVEDIQYDSHGRYYSDHQIITDSALTLITEVFRKKTTYDKYSREDGWVEDTHKYGQDEEGNVLDVWEYKARFNSQYNEHGLLSGYTETTVSTKSPDLVIEKQVSYEYNDLQQKVTETIVNHEYSKDASQTIDVTDTTVKDNITYDESGNLHQTYQESNTDFEGRETNTDWQASEYNLQGQLLKSTENVTAKYNNINKTVNVDYEYDEYGRNKAQDRNSHVTGEDGENKLDYTMQETVEFELSSLNLQTSYEHQQRVQTEDENGKPTLDKIQEVSKQVTYDSLGREKTTAEVITTNSREGEIRKTIDSIEYDGNGLKKAWQETTKDDATSGLTKEEIRQETVYDRYKREAEHKKVIHEFGQDEEGNVLDVTEVVIRTDVAYDEGTGQIGQYTDTKISTKAPDLVEQKSVKYGYNRLQLVSDELIRTHEYSQDGSSAIDTVSVKEKQTVGYDQSGTLESSYDETATDFEGRQTYTNWQAKEHTLQGQLQGASENITTSYNKVNKNVDVDYEYDKYGRNTAQDRNTTTTGKDGDKQLDYTTKEKIEFDLNNLGQQSAYTHEQAIQTVDPETQEVTLDTLQKVSKQMNYDTQGRENQVSEVKVLNSREGEIVTNQKDIAYDNNGLKKQWTETIEDSATTGLTTTKQRQGSDYDQHKREQAYKEQVQKQGVDEKGNTLDVTETVERKTTEYSEDNGQVSSYVETSVSTASTAKETTTTVAKEYNALDQVSGESTTTKETDNTGDGRLETVTTTVRTNIIYDLSGLLTMGYLYEETDKNGKVVEGVWDSTSDGRLMEMYGMRSVVIGDGTVQTNDPRYTGYDWKKLVQVEENGTTTYKRVPSAVIDYGIAIENGQYYRWQKNDAGEYEKIAISDYKVELKENAKGEPIGLYRVYKVMEDGKLVEKKERIRLTPMKSYEVQLEEIAENSSEFPKDKKYEGVAYTGYCKIVTTTYEYEDGTTETEVKKEPLYDNDVVTKIYDTERAKYAQENLPKFKEWLEKFQSLVQTWEKQYQTTPYLIDSSYGYGTYDYNYGYGYGSTYTDPYQMTPQQQFEQMMQQMLSAGSGTAWWTNPGLLSFYMFSREYGDIYTKWVKEVQKQELAQRQTGKQISLLDQFKNRMKILTQMLAESVAYCEKYKDEKEQHFYVVRWDEGDQEYKEVEISRPTYEIKKDENGVSFVYRNYKEGDYREVILGSNVTIDNDTSGSVHSDEYYATREISAGENAYGYNLVGQLVGYQRFEQHYDQNKQNATGTKSEDIYAMTYDKYGRMIGLSGQLVDQGKTQYYETFGVQYNSLGQQTESYRSITDFQGATYFEHKFNLQYNTVGQEYAWESDITQNNARQYIIREKTFYNDLGQIIEYYEFNSNPFDAYIIGQGATTFHRYDIEYNKKGDQTAYKEEGTYRRNKYKMFEDSAVPNLGAGSYELTWYAKYDQYGNMVKAVTQRTDLQNETHEIGGVSNSDSDFYTEFNPDGYHSKANTTIVETWEYENGRKKAYRRDFHQEQTQTYKRKTTVEWEQRDWKGKKKKKDREIWVKVKLKWTIDTVDTWEGKYDEETGNLISYETDHDEDFDCKSEVVDYEKFEIKMGWFDVMMGGFMSILWGDWDGNIVDWLMDSFTNMFIGIGMLVGAGDMIGSLPIFSEYSIIARTQAQFDQNRDSVFDLVETPTGYHLETNAQVDYVYDDEGRIIQIYKVERKRFSGKMLIGRDEGDVDFTDLDDQTAVVESYTDYEYDEDTGYVKSVTTSKTEKLYAGGKEDEDKLIIDKWSKIKREYLEHDEYHRAIRWLDTITDKWGTYTTERVSTIFNEYGQETATRDITKKEVQGEMMIYHTYTEKKYDAKGRESWSRTRTIKTRVRDGETVETVDERVAVLYYEIGPFKDMPYMYEDRSKNVTNKEDWNESKARAITYNGLGMIDTALMKSEDSDGDPMYVKWYYKYDTDGRLIEQKSEMIEEIIKSGRGKKRSKTRRRMYTVINFKWEGRDMVSQTSYTYFWTKTGFGSFRNRTKGYTYTKTTFDEFGEVKSEKEYTYTKKMPGFFHTTAGKIVWYLIMAIIILVALVATICTVGIAGGLLALAIMLVAALTVFMMNQIRAYATSGVFSRKAFLTQLAISIGSALIPYLGSILGAVFAAVGAVVGMISSVAAQVVAAIAKAVMSVFAVFNAIASGLNQIIGQISAGIALNVGVPLLNQIINGLLRFIVTLPLRLVKMIFSTLGGKAPVGTVDKMANTGEVTASNFTDTVSSYVNNAVPDSFSGALQRLGDSLKGAFLEQHLQHMDIITNLYAAGGGGFGGIAYVAVYEITQIVAQMLRDFIQEMVILSMEGRDIKDSEWFVTGDSEEITTPEEEEERIRESEESPGYASLLLGMSAGSFASSFVLNPLVFGTLFNFGPDTNNAIGAKFFSGQWFKGLSNLAIYAPIKALVDSMINIWRDKEYEENRELRRKLREIRRDPKKRKQKKYKDMLEYYKRNPVEDEDFIGDTISSLIDPMVSDFSSNLTEAFNPVDGTAYQDPAFAVKEIKYYDWDTNQLIVMEVNPSTWVQRKEEDGRIYINPVSSGDDPKYFIYDPTAQTLTLVQKTKFAHKKTAWRKHTEMITFRTSDVKKDKTGDKIVSAKAGTIQSRQFQDMSGLLYKEGYYENGKTVEYMIEPESISTQALQSKLEEAKKKLKGVESIDMQARKLLKKTSFDKQGKITEVLNIIQGRNMTLNLTADLNFKFASETGSISFKIKDGKIDEVLHVSMQKVGGEDHQLLSYDVKNGKLHLTQLRTMNDKDFSAMAQKDAGEMTSTIPGMAINSVTNNNEVNKKVIRKEYEFKDGKWQKDFAVIQEYNVAATYQPSGKSAEYVKAEAGKVTQRDITRIAVKRKNNQILQTVAFDGDKMVVMRKYDAEDPKKPEKDRRPYTVIRIQEKSTVVFGKDVKKDAEYRDVVVYDKPKVDKLNKNKSKLHEVVYYLEDDSVIARDMYTMTKKQVKEKDKVTKEIQDISMTRTLIVKAKDLDKAGKAKELKELKKIRTYASALTTEKWNLAKQDTIADDKIVKVQDFIYEVPQVSDKASLAERIQAMKKNPKLRKQEPEEWYRINVESVVYTTDAGEKTRFAKDKEVYLKPEHERDDKSGKITGHVSRATSDAVPQGYQADPAMRASLQEQLESGNLNLGSFKYDAKQGMWIDPLGNKIAPKQYQQLKLKNLGGSGVKTPTTTTTTPKINTYSPTGE